MFPNRYFASRYYPDRYYPPAALRTATLVWVLLGSVLARPIAGSVTGPIALSGSVLGEWRLGSYVSPAIIELTASAMAAPLPGAVISPASLAGSLMGMALLGSYTPASEASGSVAASVALGAAPTPITMEGSN